MDGWGVELVEKVTVRRDGEAHALEKPLQEMLGY